MARDRASQTEVLVHVAAPSRATDDTIYRQLAQAYLAFQPCTRAELEPRLPPACRRGAAQIDDSGDGLQQQQQQRQQQQGAIRDDRRQEVAQEHGQGQAASLFADLESADISFRSALDNRASPRLRTTTAEEKGSPPHEPYRSDNEDEDEDKAEGEGEGEGEYRHGERESWHPPPSEIDDSYPMPDVSFLNSGSPSKLLEQYMGYHPSSRFTRLSNKGLATMLSSSSPFSSSSSPVPCPITSQQPVPVAVIPVTPASSQPQLPSSPSRKHPRTAAGLEADDTDILDITHVSSSPIPSSSPRHLCAATSSPPPPCSKRARFETDRTETHTLARSASDTAALRRNHPKEKERQRRRSRDVDTSLEAFPPSPQAGITDLEPSDLISDKLAKLALDLSSRYRPDVKRPLDPLERGYWLVDCTSWTSRTRSDTWNFLATYIRRGNAGWGVWSRRSCSSSGNIDGPGEGEGTGEGHHHLQIRVFGWGHVAKHTYLLLYLASGRQLKKTGAKWVGADGEVLLEVAPHGK